MGEPWVQRDQLRPGVRCRGVDARVAVDVLQAAGVEIPDEQEDEVERFREFLDQVSPDDFAPES